MIMTTFAEGLDVTGKTIHPLTTHAMSGLGTTERDYAASCPGATLGEGLAVRGEEVAGATGRRGLAAPHRPAHPLTTGEPRSHDRPLPRDRG